MEKQQRLQRIVSEIQRMMGFVESAKEKSITVINEELPFGGSAKGAATGREKYSVVIEFLPIDSCKSTFLHRTSSKERMLTLIRVPSIPPFAPVAALVEWNSSSFPLVRFLPINENQVDWFVEEVKDLLHFHRLLVKANRQVYGKVSGSTPSLERGGPIAELLKEHLTVGTKIRGGLSYTTKQGKKSGGPPDRVQGSNPPPQRDGPPDRVSGSVEAQSSSGALALPPNGVGEPSSTRVPLDGYPNDAKPSTRSRRGRGTRAARNRVITSEDLDSTP
jgi:hypothetical protein